MPEDEEKRTEVVCFRTVSSVTSVSYCYTVGREFIEADDERTEKRRWSSTAPDWRTACNGLNLEGRCTNSSCCAYNKGRVIHQWGYGAFDLFEQGHLCACPQCGEHVEAETCGFTNCKWKASGRKRVANDKPPVTVPGKWRDAPSDGYTTFDDMITRMVRWDKLVLEAKRL